MGTGLVVRVSDSGARGILMRSSNQNLTSRQKFKPPDYRVSTQKNPSRPTSGSAEAHRYEKST